MAARHPPCRALKPKEKDYKVTDRDGMYVHVTAKGAMSFRMDCQPMSWLRSTMQPSRPSRNGHPISTAFRFRSGAKDPERNTLRNAVINWPDGDEGEKSHFRDGSRAAVAGRLMAQPVYPQIGLPPASEIAGAFRHLRFVPTGDSSTAVSVIVAGLTRQGRNCHGAAISFVVRECRSAGD
jgi:hypothetical protein